MLIAHTKKQQQQEQNEHPPGSSPIPVQAVYVTDQHSLQGLIVFSDEGQGQLEVAVDGDTTIIIFLLDEFIADCVEKDVPIVLMQLAMEKGEKAWGCSTVMFVGVDRAGKTGNERSMLGYAFEHTESTVGVNNKYMFEVTSALANVDGDANFAGESRWLLAEKAEKEYESALAKLASAIQQGTVYKVNFLEQNMEEQKAKMEALKKDLVKAGAAVTVAPSVDATLSSVPSSSSASSSQAAQPAVPSPVAVIPAGGGADAGGVVLTVWSKRILFTPSLPPSRKKWIWNMRFGCSRKTCK